MKTIFIIIIINTLINIISLSQLLRNKTRNYNKLCFFSNEFDQMLNRRRQSKNRHQNHINNTHNTGATLKHTLGSSFNIDTLYIIELLQYHLNSNTLTPHKKLAPLLPGSSFNMLSIVSWKPALSILSASSSTRHDRWSFLKRLVVCRWCRRRPGVATTMLTPAWRRGGERES